MLAKHHPVCRVRGGSNDPRHLLKVDRVKECKMHAHEGVRLFHEKLLHLIDDWHSTDVIPEARERVRNIIGEFGPEMYQPYAVRDWGMISRNFTKQGGIYIPKDYEY